MGYGATRVEERVAASLGLSPSSASIEFCGGQDIANGGVLLALPALLLMGLLEHESKYALPRGFYGLTSIFLLLALTALARIASAEKLRFEAPGEWGQLLGLDRIPEVRTLREKLNLLCSEPGRAADWNAALAKRWITEEQICDPVFYADGHVRIYHGRLTKLPKHYVSRQKLYHRATVDYYVNAMNGQPFCYINQAVDHGLVAALRIGLVPWVEENLVVSVEHRQRMEADPKVPLCTMVFDREGYSPDLFGELWEKRIAVITYHRYPKEEWPVEEFREERVELAGGVTEVMKLAERKVELSRKKVSAREVRRLTEEGRQISMVSTNLVAEGRRLATLLFARWSQENYFRYMRQHFGLDALVEHGKQAMPDTEFTVNPAWREANAKVRRKLAEWKRVKALLGAFTLQKPLSESAMQEYESQQGQLQDQCDAVGKELEELKTQRRAVPHHVKVSELPAEFAFERLPQERKQFLDTIKMVAYRAESIMVATVREKLARNDDGRALLQQIFTMPADLIPDLEDNTLTVRLHHSAQRAHDVAIGHLCEALNATETLFPGTKLRLVYKLGSA